MTTNFLSIDDINQSCPAAFGKAQSIKLTKNYGLVPTVDLIQTLHNEGWGCTTATQSYSKLPDRLLTNRHLMRFRKYDSKPILNECHPEIIIMNSHSGACSFYMSAGLYRLVCANGLVVSDATFETKKFKHSKNVVGNIIEGTYEVLNSVDEITDGMKKYNGLLINGTKRKEFVKRSLKAIGKDPKAYSLDELIKPQRQEDKRPSLWNTYNILQEKVINGTDAPISNPDFGSKRKFSGITSPRNNVSTNKALWETMETFYKEIKH